MPQHKSDIRPGKNRLAKLKKANGCLRGRKCLRKNKKPQYGSKANGWKEAKLPSPAAESISSGTKPLDGRKRGLEIEGRGEDGSLGFPPGKTPVMGVARGVCSKGASKGR